MTQRKSKFSTRASQWGSAMVDFVVVGPVISLIGMGTFQYSLLFNAKNMVNQASYMAARQGSMGNANMRTIENTYTRALIPLYGGGRDETELLESYARAKLDLVGHAKFEMINPTAQSFAQWNDASLEAKYGAPAIPNAGQAFKDPAIVKGSPAQNIQDANILKLKITHGYELKVPIVGKLISEVMLLADDGADPFVTALYAAGRLPIVTAVTLQMQSDAVKPEHSIVIAGVTGGASSSGGSSTVVNSGGNTTPPAPEDPTSEPPPACEVPQASKIEGDLEADGLFDFDQAVIKDTTQLDALIAKIQELKDYQSIQVTGYTDPIGSDAFNLDLSQRRANAIQQYLLDKGITKPINAVGKGESELKVSEEACAGAEDKIACLAPNRRVHVQVVAPVYP